MTVEECIDKALSLGDSVPPSDAAYVERRRRTLSLLIEVQREIWWAGAHRWKVKEGSLTVLAAAGQVVVPDDFDDIGVHGKLYLVVGGQKQYPPLKERPEQEIIESRATGQTIDSPGIFAIFGQDATTNRDLIQLPMNQNALSLALLYNKQPPTLRDAGDPDETPGAGLTADDAALEQIPARFHETVVLNGVKAKLRESKGDARWKFLNGQYNAGLTDLGKQVARLKSERPQVPGFFGNR